MRLRDLLRYHVFYFVFLLTLWDLYVEAAGVRPLDFLVLFCIMTIGGLKLAQGDTNIRATEFHVAYIILSMTLISAVVGALGQADSAKIAFGVTLGLIVFLYFCWSDIRSDVLERTIEVILKIHVGFFIFQWLFYQAFGIYVSPFYLVGVEVRAFSNIVRSTGLFLEPATYCITTAMLVVMRYLFIRKVDFLYVISCLTMILSVSFWGIGVGFIMLLGALFERPKRFLWGLLPLVMALPFLLSFNYEKIAQITWVLDRFDGLSKDNSTNDRYLAALDGVGERAVTELIFGQGISYNYLDLGSNGLGFIISAIGLFGFIALFIALLFVSNFRRVHITFAALIVSLSAAPLWNTMIWWMWLALLFRIARGPAGHDRSEEVA